MKETKELHEQVKHISDQNDVIISTLVKILSAIDDREIEAIKIKLQEQVLQN